MYRFELVVFVRVPVEQAEHRKGSRGVSRDGVRARARAVVFMRAGEFGSRGASLRSAGDRAAFARRRDRGVLLFAYFLLDKQKKVRRLRFGNRNYILLASTVRANARTN